MALSLVAALLFGLQIGGQTERTKKNKYNNTQKPIQLTTKFGKHGTTPVPLRIIGEVDVYGFSQYIVETPDGTMSYVPKTIGEIMPIQLLHNYTDENA